MSLERLLKEQRQIITMRERQLEKAVNEVNDMRRLLQTVTREWPVQVPPTISLKVEGERLERWSDRSPRFDAMRSQLLESAILLAKNRNEPIHQSEIIASARQRSPYLKEVGEDTLTARIREMCEPMGLLNRIKQGYYFPSRKAVEGGI